MSEPINLDDLRAKAEAATPGPWLRDDGYVMKPDEKHPNGWDGYLIAEVAEHDGGIFPQEHNAEFIAAWNPHTALALLDRIERAEKVITDALAATKRGNILTPKWVTDVLAGYEKEGEGKTDE